MPKQFEKRIINTKEEAQQYAIEWQDWAMNNDLSYGELSEWQGIFAELASRFDLTEEFIENGII